MLHVLFKIYDCKSIRSQIVTLDIRASHDIIGDGSNHHGNQGKHQPSPWKPRLRKLLQKLLKISVKLLSGSLLDVF